MSLSKKLSSVLGRLMGNPDDGDKAKTDADAHIARIEAELAAMRQRLRNLEARADTLSAGARTTTPPAAASTTPTPTGGGGFRTDGDIASFFAPPTAAATTAATAAPQASSGHSTPDGGASPSSGRSKKSSSGHARSTSSSRSARAARALIMELEQPTAPLAAEQQAPTDASTDAAALSAMGDGLSDLLGPASELELPAGDPLAGLTLPPDFAALPAEEPAPAAGDDDDAAAAAAAPMEGLEGLPDVSMLGALGNDLAVYSSPAAMSLGAALAGLTELAGPQEEEEEKLLLDHGATEDINISGLRRGKKKPSLSAGGAKFSMEDAHTTVFPFGHDATRAFFGVFDGFAGKDCAQAAARILPEELEKQLAQRGLGADISDVWPTVFEASDKRLAEYEYVGSTCTAVFLWMLDGQRYLQAANVGDSNAFLFRSRHAEMLTTEHKVTSPLERQRLRDMGIEVTPNQTRINGIAVARALGNQFVKEMGLGIVSTPSVSPVYALGPEDTLLIIASDGIWDVISGQDACELIENEPDAMTMAQKLLRHAVSQVKCVDNVTVIVVRL